MSRRGHPERAAEGEVARLVVASRLEEAGGCWAMGAGGDAVRPPVAGSWGNGSPNWELGKTKGEIGRAHV